MKTLCTVMTAALLVSVAAAQNAPAKRSDLYLVSFFRAAPGKAAQLGEDLKGRAATPAAREHTLVLRHVSGDDWDYATIEHMGSKTTVDAAAPPPPAASRDLVEWHDDTFVAGPAWSEFAKTMGMAGPARSAGWVYVVATHRALPKHRDELEKMLQQPPAPGEAIAGQALFQHLDGGPWQYLALDRYNSWQDFGASENKVQAETLKGSGGWFQVREHMIWHRDTITQRIAP